MSPSITFTLTLLLLSFIGLSLAGYRGGGSSYRSSSYSYRSSFSFSSYSSRFSYYYYYYYGGYESAPPPPPFCTMTVSPLGPSKLNTTSNPFCFPAYAPPSVDYLTPFAQYASVVPQWVTDYMKLTITDVTSGNETTDMDFFKECYDEVSKALCSSYYIDCFYTNQSPCTTACLAMKACRERIYSRDVATSVALGTVKTSMWTEDCTAYPACTSSDQLCCWGLSAASSATVGGFALVVALLSLLLL